MDSGPSKAPARGWSTKSQEVAPRHSGEEGGEGLTRWLVRQSGFMGSCGRTVTSSKPAAEGIQGQPGQPAVPKQTTSPCDGCVWGPSTRWQRQEDSRESKARVRYTGQSNVSAYLKQTNKKQ